MNESMTAHKPIAKRGENRSIQIETIRNELHLPARLGRRNRMLAVRDYLCKHPGISRRAVCEAAEISHVTFTFFLRRKGASRRPARIKTKGAITPEMTVREKLIVAERLKCKHPNAPERAIAKSVGLDPSTLWHHLHANLRENGMRATRRRKIMSLLAICHPNHDMPLNCSAIHRLLICLGIRISLSGLWKLLTREGYTLRYSQAANAPVTVTGS